jgi:hypothetical protein
MTQATFLASFRNLYPAYQIRINREYNEIQVTPRGENYDHPKATYFDLGHTKESRAEAMEDAFSHGAMFCAE